jgi:hypothetical protein
MSRVQVVDTRSNAERSFEVFHDRRPRKATEMPFGWPRRMQEIGVGGAELYRSNKWMKNLRDYEDYKHVAEGSRTVYATPGFLREWGRASQPLTVVGPTVSFQEPMPKHFTRLGPLLGIQIRLYEEAEDGKLRVPRGDEGLYEVTVARAYLGGAKHPETGETFLFVYDARGVHMILTGGSLRIEKDGIAG